MRMLCYVELDNEGRIVVQLPQNLDSELRAAAGAAVLHALREHGVSVVDVLDQLSDMSTYDDTVCPMPVLIRGNQG